jgi:hypothetical protein
MLYIMIIICTIIRILNGARRFRRKVREFDPVSLIHLMAPTALLLIPGENDNLIPIEAVREAYEKAREPKALSVLPITHFVLYKDPRFSKAADLATDWFRKHL